MSTTLEPTATGSKAVTSEATTEAAPETRVADSMTAQPDAAGPEIRELNGTIAVFPQRWI